MTAQEIFNSMRTTIMNRDYDINYIIYLEYCSKQKLSRVSKLVKKYEMDSDIDLELGVIDLKEHENDMIMVKVMNDSIKDALNRIF